MVYEIINIHGPWIVNRVKLNINFHAVCSLLTDFHLKEEMSLENQCSFIQYSI